MTRSSLWRTPFLQTHHHELIDALLAWDMPDLPHEPEEFEHPVREILSDMADQGLLDFIVPGAKPDEFVVDVRAICLIREILTYRSGGLADTSFVMQGIGTGVFWLSGMARQFHEVLTHVRRGKSIAAFALTEPDAGSDVANITTSARRDGGGYVLNGTKTYISNAGIADHYVVIARTGEAPGSRGLSAFFVPADTPGLTTEKQQFVAPHAGGMVTLTDCRVPGKHMIGEPGQGFRLAMKTFDIFRVSVGAAAVGFGRRALDEAITRTTARTLFDKKMIEIDGVQAKLAEMATEMDTAGLHVYRAAWAKDVRGGRCSLEVSMAKMVATEAAQRVVDDAVQIFGGAGVLRGGVIERLYREVRPMRIYEGATEVQKLIIGRELAASQVPGGAK